jgi:hypothetical protein
MGVKKAGKGIRHSGRMVAHATTARKGRRGNMPMTADTDRADCVAAATAECGMQQLVNWLPAARHEELRELLYDLTYTAIVAYVEGQPRRVPGPSAN